MNDDPTPLSEPESRLFFAFNQAIEDERRAQETYREAMGITDDPVLVALFRRLYEDEARHERELLLLYNDFKAALGAGPDGARLTRAGSLPD